MPGWGIAVGLLEQGRPTFGLFYMPLFNDLTYTNGSDKICHNIPALSHTVRTDWGDKGFLAINASAHRNYCLEVRRSCTTGSVGASLIYTARGTASAAFIPKARLWDLVAGAAIVHQAGGMLRYLSGRPVNYLELLDGNLAPEPIIAGHPDILDQLQPAIRLRKQ
jgi:fructose-1,6-bisphosphatase/inositol monophosphatase family enzyme